MNILQFSLMLFRTD